MSDPVPNPLQSCDQSAREAAQRLLRRRGEIVSQWVERVRAAVPAARGRAAPVLIDHIPRFLECLAQIIGGESPLDSLPELPGYARIHGELRARREDTSLGEVFTEYALLREVTMEALECEGPLPLVVRKVLQAGIDQAVRDAVEQYVDCTRRELQRSEERLRRLQVLSDLALARLPMDELLQELLARIRRMLKVDLVVVLLRKGDDLRVRATSGLEEEVRQDIRIPIGSGFAGRIADTGEALAVSDTREIEIVSPILRERARSLLGVPLCLEREVMGVLHVGTVSPREFTEEDRDFLQLAADRVALVIDRARLVQDLECANARKTEFLAMLAHEMRTPLTAVNSAAYLLQQIDHDERALKQLDSIQRQTRHLARLVEDLVDVSRISRGKIELRRERVDLAVLTGEVLQSVRPLIDSRGQALIANLPREPTWVNGDPVRLSQIIANLLNNAAKYTEPGGRISVVLTVVEPNARRAEASIGEPPGELATVPTAVVCVSDTGIGIDPYVLPTLFDLFAQVDPSEAKSHAGLGVGLHLVKRLAELHGGAVTAHSAGRGQGAEFCLWLPH